MLIRGVDWTYKTDQDEIKTEKFELNKFHASKKDHIY
jgi:hypothetical protein